MNTLKRYLRYCFDFTLFSIGFAIVLTMLVIVAPGTFASKPIAGGITATQVLEQISPPFAEPVISGYVGLDLSIAGTKAAPRPPIVVNALPSSPAAKAGLKKGDILLSADDKALTGLSRLEVDAAISDVVGHVIHFQVQRNARVLPFFVKVAAPAAGNDFSSEGETYISCRIP